MTAAHTRLLVLQSTGYCNLDCRYCYLSRESRSQRQRMPPDAAATAVRRLADEQMLGRDLTILWHAGEPLTVPIDYYEATIAEIRRVVPASTQLHFNIQSNGIALTEAWCDFLLRHRFTIGISIDGPREVHDANRVTRNGRPSFDLTYRGVALLRAHAVPFSTISVVTAQSLQRGREIAEFLLELDALNHGFNVEEIEGANTSSSLSGESSSLSSFISDVLHVAWKREAITRFREFKQVLRVLAEGEDIADPRSGENLPFRIVTVSKEGAVSTFSPELLGGDGVFEKRFIYGTLVKPFSELRSDPKFLADNAAVEAGVAQCREICAHFRFCGGGSPSNKFHEHGRFDVTETLHCHNHRKTFADAVMHRLNADTSQPRVSLEVKKSLEEKASRSADGVRSRQGSPAVWVRPSR